MNTFRAELRQKALGEVARLQEIHGPNSFDSELIEARANLWALEWLDNRSPENLQRLQNLVAVKGLKTTAGITTRTTLPPQSTRIKAIGMDTWRTVFREDLLVDTNPVTLAWDGSAFTLETARGGWVQGLVLIESRNAQAQTFTASFSQMSGPANIQNVSGVYENKADRPIRLFKPCYVPVNGLSHFQSDSYDDSHVAPRYQSTANPPTASTREALGKHVANVLADMTIPSVGATHSVNPAESFALYFRIWIPREQAAGSYTGAIKLTDASGGELSIPVGLTVHATQLNQKTFIPFMSYVAGGPAGERLSGELFPNPGSTAYEQEQTMVDAVAKTLRENHVVPVFDEQDGNPVPDARHSSRLLGDLYSGSGYLGPGANEQLPIMTYGIYHQWSNFSGVGGSVAVQNATTIPPALQSHNADLLAWLAANTTDMKVYAYLFDEANDEDLLAQIQKWGTWFSDFVTFATTGSTLVPPFGLNFENMIASAPSVNHISIAAPIMPKDSPQILSNHKARNSKNEASIYNGLSPMDVSNMLDEVGNAGLLRWMNRVKHHLKDGVIDLHFYWGACEWRNNEGGGVFTGAPEGTYVAGADGRGRYNMMKTGNTFGQSDINASRDFDGHSGYLYSEGDGALVAPGTDVFFPEDSFGVEDALPTLRLFNECAGIQAAQAVYQAYQIDNTVLDDLEAVMPVSLWELGVTNDGEADEERSYLNADNPLYQIDNQSLAALERAAWAVTD